jgi:5-methylcytosine-specific restriction endonuclease McrA
MVIRIGNISFNSKEKTTSYVRELINILGETEIHQQHKDFLFFTDLLHKHTEATQKIGSGIHHFTIVKNPINPKAFGMYVYRTDGTFEDFSWRKCCNPNYKKNENNIILAMRNAISEDIINFKRTNKLECCYCKKTGNSSYEFHVDHIYPFKNIQKEFIKNRTDIPNEFDDDVITNAPILKKGDKKFEDDWKQFHSNFELQILCDKCNLNKGCKNEKLTTQ